MLHVSSSFHRNCWRRSEDISACKHATEQALRRTAAPTRPWHVQPNKETDWSWNGKLALLPRKAGVCLMSFGVHRSSGEKLIREFASSGADHRSWPLDGSLWAPLPGFLTRTKHFGFYVQKNTGATSADGFQLVHKSRTTWNASELLVKHQPRGALWIWRLHFT